MPTFSVPDVQFEVSVECAECGRGLATNVEITENRRGPTLAVTVTPCDHCLAQTRDQALEETGA